MPEGSSNQTGNEGTKQSGIGINPAGINPILHFSVDRLTLLLDIKNQGDARQAAINTVKALPSWNPHWKWGRSSNLYRFTIQRSPYWMLLQASPHSPLSPALRIRNQPQPNRVDRDGDDRRGPQLDRHRSSVTSLNTATRVSRIDVALDIHGVGFDDVAVRVAHAQITNPFSRGGVLQSLYFGSPKPLGSSSSTTREPNKKKKAAHRCPILDPADRAAVRRHPVEKRQNSLTCRTRRILFDGVSIALLNQLGPGLAEPERRLLPRLGRVPGCAGCSETRPVACAAEILARWPGTAPVVDPGTIWSRWPDVVHTQVFKPINAGIAAPAPVITTDLEPCSMVSGP